MRAIVLALLGMLALATGSLAQPFASPQALLEDAYSSYSTNDFPDDPLAYYSSRLKGLWANAEGKLSEDEVGAIDFDPFINAQDYELTDLAIGAPERQADGRVNVPVSFANMGGRQSMGFTVVEEKGGWLVDDIAATTPGWEFQVSELLQAE